MSNVVVLEQPAFPPPSPLPADQVGVVPFRGRSLHRSAGCTSSFGTNNYGACCPHCDWGAYICVYCHGAEGSLPTDCPRHPMTQDQDDAVMAGTLDYILAAGGWVWSAPAKTRRPLPVCTEV